MTLLFITLAIVVLAILVQMLDVRPNEFSAPKKLGRVRAFLGRFDRRKRATIGALAVILTLQCCQVYLEWHASKEQGTNINNLLAEVKKARAGEKNARDQLLQLAAAVDQQYRTVSSRLPEPTKPFVATVSPNAEGEILYLSGRNGYQRSVFEGYDGEYLYLSGGAYYSKREVDAGFLKYPVTRADDEQSQYQVAVGNKLRFELSWSSAQPPTIAFVIGTKIQRIDVKGDGEMTGQVLIERDSKQHWSGTTYYLPVSVYTNLPPGSWSIAMRDEPAIQLAGR